MVKNNTFTPRINTKSKNKSPRVQTERHTQRKNLQSSRKTKTEAANTIEELDDGIIVSGFYLNYDELEAMNQRSIEFFNKGVNIEEQEEKKELMISVLLKNILKRLMKGKRRKFSMTQKNRNMAVLI